MVFYLVVVSIGLPCFWLYYFVLLRRTTFFNLNRWYLLGALIFCLVVPFTGHFVEVGINSELYSESVKLPYASEVLNTVELINNKVEVVQGVAVSGISWLSLCYFLGCGLLLFRFIWSIINIKWLTKSSQEVSLNGIKVYQNAHICQPFSLFNKIFIPKKWNNLPPEILCHEQEHVKKGHFVDVILLELVTILLWFNPVIYLYKKSVRLNLEYLADRAVLIKCASPLRYQSLLISNALESSIKSPITTHFATPLKNRITMMKRQKTQNWMRIALLGALPLAAGLIAMNTQNELRTPLKQSISPIIAVVEANNRPSGSPLAADKLIKISSEFGIKMDPVSKVEKLHTGIDLVASEGTPVYATADGEVVISDESDDKGNYIRIKHSDVWQTQYSHMTRNSVKAGDRVEKGQIIGYVGSTGKSTGPHLHYEVHENGKPVDPKPFMN